MNWCYLLGLVNWFLSFVEVVLDLFNSKILEIPGLEFMLLQLSFTKFHRFWFKFQYPGQLWLQFGIRFPMFHSQSVHEDVHIPWCLSVLLLQSSSPPLILQMWSPVFPLSTPRSPMSIPYPRQPTPPRRNSSPPTSPFRPRLSVQHAQQLLVFHCFHIAWAMSNFQYLTTLWTFEYPECSEMAQFAFRFHVILRDSFEFGCLRSLLQLEDLLPFVPRQFLGLFNFIAPRWLVLQFMFLNHSSAVRPPLLVAPPWYTLQSHKHSFAFPVVVQQPAPSFHDVQRLLVLHYLQIVSPRFNSHHQLKLKSSMFLRHLTQLSSSKHQSLTFAVAGFDFRILKQLWESERILGVIAQSLMWDSVLLFEHLFLCFLEVRLFKLHWKWRFLCLFGRWLLLRFLMLFEFRLLCNLLRLIQLILSSLANLSTFLHLEAEFDRFIAQNRPFQQAPQILRQSQIKT